MRQIDAANATITPQQAQAFLSGKTWRSTESSSGQHIHYSAPDGRDFAWFRGQERILAGEWRIETGPGSKGQPVTRLCLRYPAEAAHPISKAAGGQWYCRAAGSVFHWIPERANGDVLGLASRTQAPFELHLTNLTIAQLKARANP
ncbi:MAG: hypothetical protein GEV13_21990 [Rhodospirillales bacterium]|nr:hypothetical protein [Rhodospirillales bacterium]